MLKLQPNPTFKAPVSIGIPGEAPEKITVEFKYLTKTQVSDWYARCAGRDDVESLAEIIVGWEAVEVPYSRDALSKVLETYPGSARDFFRDFNKAVFEAARKN